MRKKSILNILIVLGSLVLVWFLLVQNGGDTITILNYSPDDICEAYFAFDPETNGWGRSQIGTYIRHTHSRDVRLPLYFEWFSDHKELGYVGRLVDCEGNEIAVQEGIGAESNFFVWDVR